MVPNLLRQLLVGSLIATLPGPLLTGCPKPKPAPVGSNYCVVCTQHSDFGYYGKPGRARAACPHCKSLERHRLLFLYLKRRTNLFDGKARRVLHVAPNAGLEARLRKMRQLDYKTADLFLPADLKLDITDTKLPAGSYDVVLAYHVLEHVTADAKAMREVYRILKPGGFAIMQVPISRSRPQTYENPAITSAKGRTKHFGQPDHVRLYGWRDYKRRLEAAGFSVTIDRFVDTLDRALVARSSLDPQEYLYVARKPARR